MRSFYFMLLLSCYFRGYCQPASDTIRISLGQVVTMAKERSIASRQAATVKETKYWQWRTYRSNYQPQLSLTGTLPGYSKTFTQVLQPNGTIQFQPIHNDNSSLNLSFSQSIAATGGSIYGTTQLQRFDDFDRKNTLYNGVPYGIGYSQPLWQFNALKWDKKIEPLKFTESKQAYIESMEQVSIIASGYFFDLLLAQVNLQVAETNLTNTQNIQRIANEKLDLGKISKNEILQLQLEQLKARKAVGMAKRDMQIATLNLRSYTGLTGADKIALELPAAIIDMNVATDKVLTEAYANRSDAIAFVRRIAEAKRDVAKARGDNGLNAVLTANLGYSKSAQTIEKVYQNPQDQQLVQLNFVIPVLDWGRSRSRTRTAQANQQLTEYTVEQDKQIFVQQIVTQVTLFNMMRDQVVLAAEADSIASEKYQIAKDRYVLGNLSVTDLSIAFTEKDQAKRDYISALRDFWGAYYQLRYLSLYDFEKNEKIMYK
ncbi:TolC family protein [Flavitalea sp. BT771]|uniref:TolC family protein n=1 Tax=Flavitalea sp. BT771 TaxID=3063329 RepID=UPI0026E4147F|nr:TolC family protein [Flavitalea sp. BT771]MDO6431950.1 TolC family protein [Flavitalea sp. BT771]MDV6220859.1 TolC family protein [Flavitalea sp. BT771]